MYVVTVEFGVRPDQAARFLALARENAAASRETEPGCRQFDVCRDPADPATVFLYEVYDSADAFEAHVATAHFRGFDADVAGMVTRKTVRRFREVWQ